jgi:hypothetical protein
MSTPIYDFFATSVTGEISKLLGNIGNQESTASEFAARIPNEGSSRILLNDDTAEHGQPADLYIILQRQPDARFQHCEALYPGFVLEVSYLERGNNLKRPPRDYIIHSNGDIMAVICIEVNYDGTKGSTISL